jgi:hypothetical protein
LERQNYTIFLKDAERDEDFLMQGKGKMENGKWKKEKGKRKGRGGRESRKGRPAFGRRNLLRWVILPVAAEPRSGS